MESISTLIIFVIVLAVFWKPIKGFSNTLGNSFSTIDKGLDTFNNVADRSLSLIDRSHKYDHAVSLGKLKTKIDSGKKPIATLEEIDALLNKTPKAE